MKKTVISLLLFALLIGALPVLSFAAPNGVYIHDNASLLTETAARELNKTAAAINEEYGVELYFAADFSYSDAFELSRDTYALVGSPQNALIFALTEQSYFFGLTRELSAVFTESVQDSLWQTYSENAEETYYDGIFAFMRSAENILAEVSGVSGDITAKRPLLADEQQLLTYEEELTVIEKLQTVSTAAGADIVILTTDALDYYNDEAFCDDYFDYNGYGQGADRSGILFAFDAFDPDGALYYVSTRGFGQTAFTDYAIDETVALISNDLRSGNYLNAFTVFAEECERRIAEARAGNITDYAEYEDDFFYSEPGYDRFNDYSGHGYEQAKEPYSSRAPKYALISLVIGFIAALIAVSVMKSKLRTVRFQSGASSYVRQGSMRLTENRDTFLYNKVTSRPKPQDNPQSGAHSGHTGGGSHGGGHISSSGASHGGHGGRL